MLLLEFSLYILKKICCIYLFLISVLSNKKDNKDGNKIDINLIKKNCWIIMKLICGNSFLVC